MNDLPTISSPFTSGRVISALTALIVSFNLFQVFLPTSVVDLDDLKVSTSFFILLYGFLFFLFLPTALPVIMFALRGGRNARGRHLRLGVQIIKDAITNVVRQCWALLVRVWEGTRYILKPIAMDMMKGIMERHFGYYFEETPGGELLMSSPPTSTILSSSIHKRVSRLCAFFFGWISEPLFKERVSACILEILKDNPSHTMKWIGPRTMPLWYEVVDHKCRQDGENDEEDTKDAYVCRVKHWGEVLRMEPKERGAEPQTIAERRKALRLTRERLEKLERLMDTSSEVTLSKYGESCTIDEVLAERGTNRKKFSASTVAVLQYLAT